MVYCFPYVPEYIWFGNYINRAWNSYRNYKECINVSFCTVIFYWMRLFILHVPHSVTHPDKSNIFYNAWRSSETWQTLHNCMKRETFKTVFQLPKTLVHTNYWHQQGAQRRGFYIHYIFLYFHCSFVSVLNE